MESFYSPELQKMDHAGAGNAKQPDLGSVLWDLIDSGKYQEAMDEIKKDTHAEFIISNSMDVIPVLTLKLQDCDDPPALECIESLLVHVASTAKVKEVMIVLLEELRVFSTPERFRVMLTAMQATLSRQVAVGCSPTLFTWTFKSVLEHVAKMELPSGYNLEGRERKLLDADPCVEALSDTLLDVYDFFKVFYQNIILGKLSFTGKISNTKDFMAKTMLKLFHKPLTYLDIYSCKKDDENTIYRTASKLVAAIVRLHKNPMSLLEESKPTQMSKRAKKRTSRKGVHEKKKRDDEGNLSNVEEEEEEDDSDKDDGDPLNVSQTSLATLFYCVLHQHMSAEAIPLVYSPLYIWLQCLPLVCRLLERTEHLALHKGILLAKALLETIDQGTMPGDCLDAPCHYQFNKLLVTSMTMVDNKELRLCALNVFRRYVSNMSSGGRYRLFESLLHSVTHAGLLGLVITEIKQNIAISLKVGKDNQQKSAVNGKIGRLLDDSAVMENKFTGAAMWKIVYLACTLPDGERTDMLDWSDKILAALNLLVFLFIRASTECNNQPRPQPKSIKDAPSEPPSPVTRSSCFNALTLPQHIGHLREALLTPLQRGLQISREHYELKQQDLLMGTSSNATDGPEMEFHLGDAIMPGMSPEQEKDVVALALSRFDMISCVLARVDAAADELLEKCKREAD